MDSDDWNDVGDMTAYSSSGGAGWAGFLITLLIVALCFWIASSYSKDETAQCAVKCGKVGTPVVLKNNEDQMVCMCKWSDGTLHDGGVLE